MAANAEERADPAWGDVVRQEPRWPSTLAVALAIALYLLLPSKLVFGPSLLLPVLEALLIVPLMIVAPHRHTQETRWQRWAAVALIAVVNAANVSSLILLV